MPNELMDGYYIRALDGQQEFLFTSIKGFPPKQRSFHIPKGYIKDTDHIFYIGKDEESVLKLLDELILLGYPDKKMFHINEGIPYTLTVREFLNNFKKNRPKH